MGTIAISTCAYLELPLAKALERIAGLAAAVEVRCKATHAIDTVSQNRALAACGLRRSVHAPDEIAIWSCDQSHRQAALSAHERLLEAAATAGAELYLVHPDYSAEPIVRRAETYAALAESFSALHELEARYPLRICVENMPGPCTSHFTTPELDLCGLGLALDVGHAQISDSLEAFLGRPRIAHLHLHDNFGYGDFDRHLPLGHGRLAPQAVAAVLERCDGLCVLEHGSEAQVRESLAFLAELEQCREVA